jgi:hypothetical protein
MFPTNNPNPENAMKLTDSVFYDSKGREIKRSYNEDQRALDRKISVFY